MATLLDRDQNLLAALREREPTAAEALITAYGDRAYRLAMRIRTRRKSSRMPFVRFLERLTTSGAKRPFGLGSSGS